ncbi:MULTISPECIES: hypothetical protein [Paenibacillus]|uniref:Uncharacterized protein n=1 Tax=Paenibacillus macerans TaxID=44252 RepID=A0A090Z9E2_PAEMA|nr:hypothetical protein [Paenibacillus macerans]KFN07247.1 hypothetical protein DJ90_5692 [Paenibacillus macerans]MCY7558247.1 hypothetical protein [Paenibacillus macerans]MEC0154615.1 hypothetical protein [Paenibacillus macerans]SUA85652.1 Uncharacterised protein [Paenibacillus macerans]
MNNALPISRVARLYEVLAHIKSFPTPIKPVAIMAGIDEDDIRDLIAPSLYTVIDDHIQHINAMKHLESVTIVDADFLYRTNGVASYVKDGRPAWLFVDGYEDRSNLRLDMLAWWLGAALDGSSDPYKPWTKDDALRRFDNQ